MAMAVVTRAFVPKSTAECACPNSVAGSMTTNVSAAATPATAAVRLRARAGKSAARTRASVSATSTKA